MSTDLESTRESTRRRVRRNGNEVAALSEEHRALTFRAGERAAVRAGHARATRRDVHVQLSRYTTI
jgi:hypothetical protein